MTAKEKEAFNVSRVLFELESHHLELLNKWTKISDLETTIFELNMMVKSGLVFYFEFLLAPSELLLPSAKKAAHKG